jgi:hypothetical protein
MNFKGIKENVIHVECSNLFTNKGRRSKNPVSRNGIDENKFLFKKCENKGMELHER